tara:strand:+ start:723 stop:1034 length:312 start_codon:yes stop_codon:yes gene_type:complete
MEDKVLVSKSKFTECVDEIATQITYLNYGEDTYELSGEDGQEHVTIFTEEAQEFYSATFDDIERLINSTLNVWANSGEFTMDAFNNIMGGVDFTESLNQLKEL